MGCLNQPCVSLYKFGRLRIQDQIKIQLNISIKISRIPQLLKIKNLTLTYLWNSLSFDTFIKKKSYPLKNAQNGQNDNEEKRKMTSEECRWSGMNQSLIKNIKKSKEIFVSFDTNNYLLSHYRQRSSSVFFIKIMHYRENLRL